MKFMFLIQGEGRGHTTQAIAIKELLETNGHDVIKVMMGHRGDRDMRLARQHFPCLTEYISPNLVYGKNRRTVSVVKTLTEIVKSISLYRTSMDNIHTTIQLIKPDIIVNFYEALFGVYQMFYKKEHQYRSYTIGHQFMFLHPSYIPMRHYPIQMWGAKLLTKIAGAGSEHIALSFYDAPKHGRITVVPPILRKQLFEVDKTKTTGDFILAYVINEGYAKDFYRDPVRVHRPVKLFTEVKEPKRTGHVLVHPLNGELFLDMMGRCEKVICTAGFESVAEALYLGKPLLMRPVDGHMEQYFNAKDAHRRVGNCRVIKSFTNWENTSVTIDEMKLKKFRSWVNQCEPKILEALKL